MKLISKLFSICCGFSPCFVLIVSSVGAIFHGWHIIKIKRHAVPKNGTHNFPYSPSHRVKMLSSYFVPMEIAIILLFNKLWKFSNGNFQNETFSKRVTSAYYGFIFNFPFEIILDSFIILYQTMIQQ